MIEKAISVDNGKAIFKSDLPLSSFIIKETKAPKGYIASEEVINVDVEYKGQDTKVINLEYEMKNEKMKGHIQIIKTSSADNKYSGLPKGSPLENVVFEIYDSENKLVDKVTTDKDGKATTKELVIGNYEARVKMNLSEEETDNLLANCKTRLENFGYQVFFTGARFVYDNCTRTVQDNELMIAIKEK